MLAQRLYEGIEVGQEGPVGLSTYMRTDSTRIADEAIDEARRYISERYGEAMLPEKPNFYKSKKGAQDAHEAIRPTSVFRDPDSLAPYLDRDELKLYRLIWTRFVASQMPPAVFDETIVEIEAGRFLLRARGSVLKFNGFLALYEEGRDEEPDRPKKETQAAAGEDSEEAEKDDGSGKLPQLTEGE